MKITVLISALILFVRVNEATLLKNKEISHLEAETLSLDSRMQQCEEHIKRLRDSFRGLESYQIQKINIEKRLDQLELKIKSADKEPTETILNRLIALELKMMQIEQVGTPGSLQRRPAYRRGFSGNKEQKLTPNTSHQDDYFSPSSPYRE